MNREKIIILWGILDLASIGWYLVWNILHGQIPFYYAIRNAFDFVDSFGFQFPIIINGNIIPNGCYIVQVRSVEKTFSKHFLFSR